MLNEPDALNKRQLTVAEVHRAVKFPAHGSAQGSPVITANSCSYLRKRSPIARSFARSALPPFFEGECGA
jgi:hypothetical protein